MTTYPTNTSAEKSVLVDFPKLIGAVLSSSLFWFYQQIYTDGLNLKLYEVESFPVPDFNKLSNDDVKTLEVIYEKYLDDIELHANKRIVGDCSSYNVNEFKEYKIGHSKKIIDEIDDFIGPLYGLTKEEIEFIKNYEIEFRMADYLSEDELAALSRDKTQSLRLARPGCAGQDSAQGMRLTGPGTEAVPGETRRAVKVARPIEDSDDEELE